MKSTVQALEDALPFGRIPVMMPTSRFTGVQRMQALARIYNVLGRYGDYDAKRLLRIKRSFKPKRVFVIGNGPSLREETHLENLEDEVTLVSNGFLFDPIVAWDPTFHFVEDHLVAEDRQAELARSPARFFLAPDYLSYLWKDSPQRIFFRHRPRPSFPDGYDLTEDFSKVSYTSGTVTTTMLQFALWLEPEEIYLLGVDANYAIPDETEVVAGSEKILVSRGKDPNHFDPSYFGPGMRWHDPDVPKMLASYEAVRAEAERRGVRVTNASVAGSLEVFPRTTLANLFGNESGSGQTQGVTATDDSFSQRMPDAAGDKSCASYSSTKEEEPPSSICVIDALPADSSAASTSARRALFGGLTSQLIECCARDDSAELSYWPHRSEPKPLKIAARDFAHLAPHLGIRDYVFRLGPHDSSFERLFHEVNGIRSRQVHTWLFDKVEAHPNDLLGYRHVLEMLDRVVGRKFFITEALADHYGCEEDVSVIHGGSNGPPRVKSRVQVEGPLRGSKRLLYAGNLAPHMSLGAVQHVAQAVANRDDIELEILVGARWHTSAQKIVRANNVRLVFKDLDCIQFQRWLASGDAGLIAYSLDARDYAGASLPNKFSDYVQAGLDVLMVAPDDFEAVKQLAKFSFVSHATLDECGSLLDHLSESFGRPIGDVREEILELGWLLPQQCRELSRALGDDNLRYARTARARVDETAALVQFIASTGQGGEIVDVGAHTGSFSRPFVQMDRRVHSFEPNPSLSRKLIDEATSHPSWTIHSSAIGTTSEERNFYTTSESSGASTLEPFLDSHELSSLVEVVEVNEALRAIGCERESVAVLKFDCEGIDADLICQLEIDHWSPAVIVAEYDDFKDFLNDRHRSLTRLRASFASAGYSCVVSVWHPVVRYGIQHDFLGVFCDEEEDSDVAGTWGNVFAFRDGLAAKKFALILDSFVWRDSLYCEEKHESDTSKTAGLSSAMVAKGATAMDRLGVGRVARRVKRRLERLVHNARDWKFS